MKIGNRFPGLHMIEKDLGELYTYLDLFNRTYVGYEEETRRIMDGIEAAYVQFTGCKDPEVALRRLRNPREAGRKAQYTAQDLERIRTLRGEGLSVREISAETGIPRSTISRLLGNR